MEIEVEAASMEQTMPRTRKPRDGKPRVAERRTKSMIEEAQQPAETSQEKINGYPISDGFARIMVFADPSEGNKICFFPVKFGDHPKIWLAKNRMHVLPMGVVNNIVDTANEYPVDDLSDEAHPTRFYETRARLPHSDPIPATPQEYRDYLNLQSKLMHPNKYKKL